MQAVMTGCERRQWKSGILRLWSGIPAGRFQ